MDYNEATRNAIQTRIREAFTLSDTAITAYEGSNPYWDPAACSDKSNRYRVHLTKRGTRGLENEMSAVADDLDGPVGTVLMMRIYLPEDKDSPHVSEESGGGGEGRSGSVCQPRAMHALQPASYVASRAG